MSSARPTRRQAEYSESEREESEYETEEEEEEEERPRSRKRVKEPEDEYEEDAEEDEEEEEEDAKANRYSEEDEEAEVRKVNKKKRVMLYVVRNEKDHPQIVILCCGECRQRRNVVVAVKGKGLSRMRRSLLREKLRLTVVWPWFMTVTKTEKIS